MHSERVRGHQPDPGQKGKRKRRGGRKNPPYQCCQIFSFNFQYQRKMIISGVLSNDVFFVDLFTDQFEISARFVWEHQCSRKMSGASLMKNLTALLLS